MDAYRQYIKSFKSRIGLDNNRLQQDRAWQIIGTIEQKWQHFHFFHELIYYALFFIRTSNFWAEAERS